MSSSIRGHQGQFRLFQDGALVGIVNCTNVDVNQDSAFMRSYYVGQGFPEGDQAIEGWSGSAEFEVKDSSIDDFIDALITNNVNGIGVSTYNFIIEEFYADGTSKGWVYSDLQWKMSRKAGGLQEKITKRLEFQASSRKALS